MDEKIESPRHGGATANHLETSCGKTTAVGVRYGSTTAAGGDCDVARCPISFDRVVLRCTNSDNTIARRDFRSGAPHIGTARDFRVPQRVTAGDGRGW